jgi:hypothetical protein
MSREPVQEAQFKLSRRGGDGAVIAIAVVGRWNFFDVEKNLGPPFARDDKHSRTL